MASTGLLDRLYRGEANLNIVGRRRMWFIIVAIAVLVAIGSFLTRGFTLGIEFQGGTKFAVPVSVGTQSDAQSAVRRAVDAAVPGVTVSVAQRIGTGAQAKYEVRTSPMSQPQADAVKQAVAADVKVPLEQISDSRVSATWGASVTRQAGIGLAIFLLLVTAYLVVRFEWRMATAAVASLLIDLVLTAGIYSLVGFEVTPSTVIGFLTILGFSLYDVVVVFDKVQENTRGITAGSSRTYAEATNLAVNQTLMRSINTSLVALLPVGGLLFIGAGLLGAGTLKDLGLVLFVGMGLGVLLSIIFAAPGLTVLKDHEPRIKAHNQRVLARRSAARSGDVAARGAERATGAESHEEVAAVSGSAPRVGARPTGKRNTNRGGRSGGAGNRPNGSKRR